jgi:hypothetical protein
MAKSKKAYRLVFMAGLPRKVARRSGIQKHEIVAVDDFVVWAMA